MAMWCVKMTPHKNTHVTQMPRSIEAGGQWSTVEMKRHITALLGTSSKLFLERLANWVQLATHKEIDEVNCDQISPHTLQTFLLQASAVALTILRLFESGATQSVHRESVESAGDDVWTTVTHRLHASTLPRDEL